MRSSLARRESTWGLLFLAPWLIGFVLFFAGPMLASLGASFTDLVLVRPGEMRFVGLDNWARLVGDPLVRKSLVVTGTSC
jgi:multiple sugar transport system permease protein